MATPKALASSISSPTTAGAFQDAIGNVLANGKIILDLSQPASATGGGEIVPRRVTITLDANGKVSASQVLWANDQLSPSGTTYSMLVFDSANNLVGGFGNISISGAVPIDLALITPVSSGGSVINFAGIIITSPTAQQVINGFALVMEGAPFAFSAAGSTTADTGISRTASGIIAFGNGTQGDTTGTGLAAIFNAGTGFRVNNTAAANRFLKGDGTNFVSGIPVLASADFANQGTTTTVLHGNAAGNPSFGFVVLTTDVTGILPTANGGTGQNSSATYPTSGVVVTEAATETLTSKRITQRVQTAADATSITPTSDTADITIQTNTQVSGTLTLNAPTGTPTDGQKLIIRIKSTNSQTYSFNATYRFSTTVTAPTTLAAGKTDYLGLMFNSTDTKWDVVAVDSSH